MANQRQRIGFHINNVKTTRRLRRIKIITAATYPARQMIKALTIFQRNRIIGSLEMPKVTPASIADRQTFAGKLDDVRALGFACDDEEHEIGLRCTAAPVFDEHGTAVAAISVSGPAARISRERLSALGRTVAAAALEATREFGGISPVPDDTPKPSGAAANDNRAAI